MPNAYNSTRWTGPQLDAIYPVGSIYMSVNATDPGTLFGGTWERISGKFLLAADETYEAGTTGGAASVTSGGTAITIAQMPAHNHGSAGSHNHTVPYRTGTNLGTGSSGMWVTDPGTVTARAGATGDAGAHTHTTQGSGQAHTHTVSTIPPYLSVYMWKRTA